MQLPAGAGRGLHGSVSGISEIVTYGATLDEARRNAREAIELCLEVYRDKGWSLPKSDPDPRKTIKEMVPVKLARA
jgi:predicted RNase H-like HicB family nuclease